MRAVVYRGVGVVEVDDVPDPEIVEPTDAIVRVGLTAICGSDLHLFHGKAPLEPVKAMVQGKLKLRGDLAEIVRHVRAAKELVHLTTLVPTEFLDFA